MSKTIKWAGLNLNATPDLIKTCKYCQNKIVWLESRRTGKAYPVNYVEGLVDVCIWDFHKCNEFPQITEEGKVRDGVS